ncbi:uncharacterized protein LTR77_006887 [Saxophila tyrrhenica]|uniref:Meiotic expression up-regulated protein 6 PH domain-containing protein n=1 Tax=Saxophila tyrrhenica TaxID=1690608 RepID=A0AAV9P6L9_9PEZI|nr:hypothetical protein LTR77_006887 [Saxophila tyrrhenica]
MSDVQQQHTATEAPVSEPVATQQPETTTTTAPTTAEESTPIADAMAKPESHETKETPITDSIINSPEHKDAIESTPVAEEKKDAVAAPEKKPVEPITEGQLALKGPGLLKSIIPSKKEFWLGDDAVTPQDLSSYMRGEKPEIAHHVVAWASQTGKGLLFFNKKGDTSKKTPGHVLALYDATDLKKESPHEIAFKLNGQEHVLKATSDNERDGWYMSIEKAMELGKSQKEEVREGEGYKAEMEKLNKPAGAATTAAAAAKRSQSQPKKSMDVDKTDATTPRNNSDSVEEEKKDDKKSRSTSRGVFDRLKGKKEEAEVKREEKKEEKEEKKVEETAPEEHKTEEAPVAAGLAGGAVAGAAVAGSSSTDDKKEEPIESSTATAPTTTETKTEEKPKPAKRGSIFGKMQGWGNMKSPSKEKEQKDAELKPEVPPKDGAVAENPPVLPETATTEPAEDALKTDGEVKPETAAEEKKATSTPAKEKPTFLSNLSFGSKRNRSVSPSAGATETPVKAEETSPVEAPKETEPAAPVEEPKTEQPIGGTETVDPISPLKPEDATNNTADTKTTDKRQSVFSNLGRRASKAFKGMQSPKRENTTPATAATTESTPAETEQSQQQIGDVVPEAIADDTKKTEQPPAVAASA